jgi:hypothetical protein
VEKKYILPVPDKKILPDKAIKCLYRVFFIGQKKEKTLYSTIKKEQWMLIVNDDYDYIIT